jgi:DNA-binding transcriptional LysR family regulator
MELRHLRYFITVAEELNFSRAAERLHMAQPPLSQQIRTLEVELGVQLFERGKRPLQLTHAGQAFLKEARLVLAQVEQAAHIAQQASRGEIGRLAIGFNSSVIQSVLPQVLHQFRSQFPKIELSLSELDSQIQIQQLHTSQIDCGFLHVQQQNEDGLDFFSVLKEPLVVALSSNHPLSACECISLKSLAQEPFILPPAHVGQRFYHQIINLCQDNGFTPTVIQEAKWLQTVLGLVVAEIGIALVPASTRTLQRAGVVYRAVDAVFEMETVVAWQQDNMSPMLQEFLKVVQDAAQCQFNTKR